MVFCSSARRHTSWPRDWSSDVCSSDLQSIGRKKLAMLVRRNSLSALTTRNHVEIQQDAAKFYPSLIQDIETAQRSEERRVGKECRSRGRLVTGQRLGIIRLIRSRLIM